MKVILLEKIKGLGKLGSLVDVRAGYARNFLIPCNKVVLATPENEAKFEKSRAEFEKKASDELTNAEQRAAALSEIELTLTAKAGDGGKLFGSIGVRDLISAIASAGVEVSRSEIRLPDGPIRYVGEYDILIQLHTDVKIAVKVYVKSE
ncbi:MAG: 50S ribosomal protein L9 [Endozoicomonadaceae bacterium]|nr:50S ribosomal protein L9 [Endozoicomonadaceae bacterium]MCY4328477.1 50S ribosomal protein L9 [Endozoicomonadaceae bacterium]